MLNGTTACGVMVWLALASAAAAVAQTAAGLSFEVASIRAEEAPRNYIRMQVNGSTFVAEGATATILIRYACDLKHFQLTGGPDWIRDRDAQFIVQGRLTGEPRVDRVRAMVQQLLAERFQLQVRRETRPATIYELVVARGGAKIAASAGDNPTRRGCWPYPATCTDVSMDDFADYLSDVVLGATVVNRTGLAGRYDMKVAWSPDNAQFRGVGGAGFFSGDGPSLFTAVREQADSN